MLASDMDTFLQHIIHAAARGERAIWQRRFWEHRIRDEEDFRRHVEYCYINPVKHGLVTRVRDWPHSSFHRDVRAGVVPEDWASDVSAAGEFGGAGVGRNKRRALRPTGYGLHSC